MQGLDFDKITQNPAAKAQLVTNIKQAFLEQLPGDYTLAHLNVTLYKGSVKARVDVIPRPDIDTASLKEYLQVKQDILKETVVTKVKALPEVADLLEEGRDVSELSVTATDFKEVIITTTTTIASTTFESVETVAASSGHARVANCLWTAIALVFSWQQIY